MTFTIGEEVLYDELRYAISQIDTNRTYPYRLLATTSRGTSFVWARKADLKKIEAYTKPK